MAASQYSVLLSDLAVDDFYFSLLSDEQNEENIFSVSDAKYAEELQSQEALMASTVTTQMAKSSLSSSLTIQENTVLKPDAMEILAGEAGESSLSFCEICAERKECDQMFTVKSCRHSFCFDCISKHVATKIQDGITTVTCPGLHCKSILEYDASKPLLPKQVELWDEAFSEELFDASQRFYCPFKDCSGLLVNDNKGEVIRESECPFCHRLFCALCYIPWHPGVDCEEFQRMKADESGREDLMVRELAKDKNWSRCPQCKFYVERTGGCPHMTCRCKFQFCYECGSEWTANHGWVHRQKKIRP